MRTFYYRLLRLIALSIHPVFVFDGPNKPPFKRNKRTGGPGASVASIPEFLAKQLLKQFGFPIHLAPGEAEAECALLQREGIVDAVLSEDVDTLMFGSGVTIRNWSPEQSSSKTPTHVNVYDAIATKSGPSGLDREGMILVALMSGGDYVPEGIPGCGPKKACEAARAGFGSDLCRLAKGDKNGLREWRDRLQHEIKTNQSKFFAQKRPSLKIPDDFPRVDILGYYTHPAVSDQSGLEKLRRSIKFDQDIDFAGLRSFAHDAFDWVKLEGAKHFIRSLAPSLLVRNLRLRGERINRFPSRDLQAIQEDEALLVKGIHGKRQHAITDGSTELRISFTPIELVKIDLSTEEPDDEVEAPPGSEGDPDDEIPMDVDDDVEGSKKRGPTKFDPYKAARTWVIETYVKVGVPLKVQDWEAERQRPLKSKRTASANEASAAAPKPRSSRRTKTADGAAQPSIQTFARITKPGVRPPRARSKTPVVESSEAPAKATDHAISLLSTPSAESINITSDQKMRETSFSPLPELSGSITKRRRDPMQRAHTLPSNPITIFDRPASPQPNIVDTLDLVDTLPAPSPSRAPVKKARTRTTHKTVPSRSERAGAIGLSPVKNRQTTLDNWTSPPNPRRNVSSRNVPSIPQAPRFTVSKNDVETLDLTLSSPIAPSTEKAQDKPKLEETSPAAILPKPDRPPLGSLPSNRSIASQTSSSIPADRSKLAPTSRRMSPRSLPKTSDSPEIDSVDLTEISSPMRAPPPVADQQQSREPASSEIDSLDLTNRTSLSSPSKTSTSQRKNRDTALRRSPRVNKSPPIYANPRVSPPAAWKSQAKKKREIVLRKSLAGAWAYVEVESPAKTTSSSNIAPKGRDRRRWRESEIEVLDLC